MRKTVPVTVQRMPIASISVPWMRVSTAQPADSGDDAQATLGDLADLVVSPVHRQDRATRDGYGSRKYSRRLESLGMR